MRLRRIALAASALALAGCSTTPSATQADAPSPALAPASASAAPLAGVFEGNGPAALPMIRAFGDAAGVRPTIALSYSGWWVPFDTSLAGQERAYGATQLVQMDPQGISLAEIAAGKYDAYLRSYAGAVKAFGHPVILGFGHEMNGTWYGWGKGRTSPAVFVSAWRHVVTVFRAQGASNVTWLWVVNAENAAGGSLLPWWPGASWVGMVGVDGYFYWQSDTFTTVFGPTITQIRRITSLPVLISETAVGPGSKRDTQIRSLFAGAAADHLRGVVWFDQTQHDGPYHQDWRLEDDPAALAAFRAAVKEYEK